MTTRKRERKRCFYDLDDRRAKVLDLAPASQAAMSEKYKCAGNPPNYYCIFLSTQWHENPKPINVIINKITSTLIEKVSGLDLCALDAELLGALKPFCRDIFFGNVLVDRGDGRSEPTRLVTVAAPKRVRIQSDRGRYCRHLHFSCCSVFTNKIGWAGGAIVERTLDDRLVYMDQDGHILVADELVESLDLKKRFPKLWLQPIPVVPEPLDGEVLPGDPGWDGTFRPAPPPELPEGEPKRGRVTYD